MISAPRESVRLYLQDIRNLSQYENKVESVEVAGENGRFTAQASGRFMGLPWKGAFNIRLNNDGGYVAELTEGSMRSMTSSYSLRNVQGGTILRHDETYHFGFLLDPVLSFFRSAFSHSMDLELHVIKEEAERVNRRLQLAKIENAA